MIDRFLLDADETILDFVRSSRESFAYAMAQAGAPELGADYPRFKSINDELWRAYERGEVTKPQLMRERFTRFFAQAGKAGQDAEEVNAVYFRTLCRTGYLLEGARGFLEELSRRGRVYLITNGTGAAQYGRLEAVGLREAFAGIFVSDEVGFAKPDKRFFDIVLKKAGAVPSQCAVIGDSLTSDMAGAKNAGIVGIWYNARGQAGAEGFDYAARSYEEVLAVVDSLRGV